MRSSGGSSGVGAGGTGNGGSGAIGGTGGVSAVGGAAGMPGSGGGGAMMLTGGTGGLGTGGGPGGSGGAPATGGAGGSTGGTGGTRACLTTKTFGENSSDDHRGGSEDTFVENISPTFNFATRPTVFIGGGTEIRVALMRFDVSAIPQSASVCSATLRLFVGSNDSSDEFALHQVLEDWEASSATWQIRLSPNVSWSAVGCGAPTSCSATSAGLFTPVGVPDTPFDVPLDAAVVQGWVSQGATNYGLAIKDTGGVDAVRIRSSEYTNGMRPRLSVTYTP